MTPAERITSVRAREQQAVAQVAAARCDLIEALRAGRDAGLTLEEMGELLGTSKQDVHRRLGVAR